MSNVWSAEATTIARQWWEEGTRFTPGVTSSVLADLLEEQETVGVLRIDLEWLRGRTSAVMSILGDLCVVCGIWPISAGTETRPTFRACVGHAYNTFHRELGGAKSASHVGTISIAPQDACRLGYSRELPGLIRAYLMHAVPRVWGGFRGGALSPYGLPLRIYGWELVLGHRERFLEFRSRDGDLVHTAEIY
jgi:hypothetical protein